MLKLFLQVNVSSHLGKMVLFSGAGLDMPAARERRAPTAFALAGTSSKSKWSATERDCATKAYELLGMAVPAPLPKHVVRRTGMRSTFY